MANKQYSASALAYLGDAAIELLVRERLVALGVSDAGRLNALSRKYVTCEAQSEAVDTIIAILTEMELQVYKRGRNSKSGTPPKYGSVAQYRRATGFEALMGYLHIEGMEERKRELFSAAYAHLTEEILQN